jgi:arabinose-5-phosphate isomerase
MLYFDNIIMQISAAFKGLDETQFDRLLSDCQSSIKRGGKIIASGLGKNVPVCEKFVGMMNSLGLPAVFMHTNSAMHGDLGAIRDGDVIFILSKSGDTVESVLLAEYIKAWNMTKWALTFNNQGQITKLCERALVLSLTHEGDLWDIVPNNSSSCYLILLQGIALQLAERLGVKLTDFKRNHPGGAIGRALKDA